MRETLPQMRTGDTDRTARSAGIIPQGVIEVKKNSGKHTSSFIRSAVGAQEQCAPGLQPGAQ